MFIFFQPKAAEIPKLKHPSASIKPVTYQGFNPLSCLNLAASERKEDNVSKDLLCKDPICLVPGKRFIKFPILL
jgi:hypothetical protein